MSHPLSFAVSVAGLIRYAMKSALCVFDFPNSMKMFRTKYWRSYRRPSIWQRPFSISKSCSLNLLWNHRPQTSPVQGSRFALDLQWRQSVEHLPTSVATIDSLDAALRPMQRDMTWPRMSWKWVVNQSEPMLETLVVSKMSTLDAYLPWSFMVAKFTCQATYIEFKWRNF